MRGVRKEIDKLTIPCGYNFATYVHQSSATPNRADLCAIIFSLSILTGDKNVRILISSDHAINACSPSTASARISNGYVTKNGGAVHNKDLLEYLYRLETLH